jgi:hypothetical protein
MPSRLASRAQRVPSLPELPNAQMRREWLGGIPVEREDLIAKLN